MCRAPAPAAVALVVALLCTGTGALVSPGRRSHAKYIGLAKHSYCKQLRSGAVQLTPEGPVFKPDTTDGVAWGRYVPGRHTASNFGQLTVNTSGAYSDEQQMFAAGFLEGYLTATEIEDNWSNMHTYFTQVMNASVERPMAWIQEQDAWVRGRCAGREESSPDRFWAAVCLALKQFDGLKAGYWAARSGALAGRARPRMSDWDFLFMQSNADLYDIIDWMDPSQRPHWDDGPVIPSNATERSRRAGERLFDELATQGKCSALIKLAPDLSEIFFGHSTWDTYTAMLRIYKHYAFELQTLRPAAARMSFSSYPGELFSDDDFYILSSGLVILQTTNKIFNDALFDLLNTSSVLSWQRVRAANWLAEDGQVGPGGGEAWAEVLALENSGTYNNQYMVTDLSRFEPGTALAPGLLWVVEQIPGLVESADATQMLAQGYWASYNVPAFANVYNASGYPDMVSKADAYGQHFTKVAHWLSHEASPRANIFRRDQAAVRDVRSMARLMRSNDWEHDPLSEGHPLCAICGRGDLIPGNPLSRGCYDTKVTSASHAKEMVAFAVNGPTQGTDLPAFDWREFGGEGLPHAGMPRRFAHSFEVQDPDELREEAMSDADGLPYVGSVMSVLSTNDVRYQGVLNHVDMPNSRITLVNGAEIKELTVEDFDIQAALLQFQKAGLEDSAAAPLVVEKAYNKDDFFDELSCDALEKSAAAGAQGLPKPDGRSRAAAQRKVDVETFGRAGHVRRGPGRGERVRTV
ncbi:hypothetical protein QBZ16_005210 [Prototheca wickerhamii]|uniref:Phospholipase B-like n=1 Tax=Prototheca wickerhamii TaxID=3111 RepID=A0AAD9MHK8_PROWI|nr:hypothetical protein QBZ16_005210 [Prototheca wickerhamii]